MRPLITQTVKVSISNNNCEQMDIDYNLLKKTELKDMRKQSLKYDEEIDYLQNLTENSRIPVPGFTDMWDDPSSESYYPHSDWQGSMGTSWIGK